MGQRGRQEGADVSGRRGAAAAERARQGPLQVGGSPGCHLEPPAPPQVILSPQG